MIKVTKSVERIKRTFLDGEDPPSDPTIPVKVVKDEASGREVYVAPDGRRLFTQEHLNTEIGEARKKTRSQLEAEKGTLLDELKTTRTQLQEKGQNVDVLSQRISELEEAALTVEERAQRSLSEIQKELENERKLRETEVTQAKALFANERITNEIAAAATKHKAVSSQQIAAIIRGNTEFREVKDRKGAHAGYEAIVKFNDVEDEKPVVRELSIDAAVKRMREMTVDYGNLFQSETKPGGGNTTLFGGPMSEQGGPSYVPGAGMTQEQFNKWRESQAGKAV